MNKLAVCMGWVAGKNLTKQAWGPNVEEMPQPVTNSTPAQTAGQAVAGLGRAGSGGLNYLADAQRTAATASRALGNELPGIISNVTTNIPGAVKSVGQATGGLLGGMTEHADAIREALRQAGGLTNTVNAAREAGTSAYKELQPQIGALNNSANAAVNQYKELFRQLTGAAMGKQ